MLWPSRVSCSKSKSVSLLRADFKNNSLSFCQEAGRPASCSGLLVLCQVKECLQRHTLLPYSSQIKSHNKKKECNTVQVANLGLELVLRTEDLSFTERWNVVMANNVGGRTSRGGLFISFSLLLVGFLQASGWQQDDKINRLLFWSCRAILMFLICPCMQSTQLQALVYSELKQLFYSQTVTTLI